MNIAVDHEVAMNTPSTVAFRTKNVIVTRTLIPIDHHTAAVKFFVDGVNGKAYGSSEDEQKAKDLAVAMSALLHE